MAPFEYLLIFAAIVLGMAASDIAMSLHRLLSAGERVKWDWIAPLAALVAFLKIVTQWWSWFGVEQIAAGVTFGMFVAILAGTILLFLLAAAALPDEIHDAPIDLKAYWAKVSARWWTLFALHWLVFSGVSIWMQVQIQHARWSTLSWFYLVLPLAVSAIVIRNRWWQTICLVGLAVFYLDFSFGRALTS